MSLAVDSLVGMFDDMRRQREEREVSQVLGEYQDAIDQLTWQSQQGKADKKELLITHLHTLAAMACMQAEIEALRDAVHEMKADHPALQLALIESEVRAPARQQAYDSFRTRACEFNAWLNH